MIVWRVDSLPVSGGRCPGTTERWFGAQVLLPRQTTDAKAEPNPVHRLKVDMLTRRYEKTDCPGTFLLAQIATGISQHCPYVFLHSRRKGTWPLV